MTFMLIPSQTIEYKRAESIVVAKNAPQRTIKHKVVKYTPPQGKVAEIAEMVARETGYPLDTISKIMFYESGYSTTAFNRNTNKTTDHSLFQINSIHIPEAQKMGLDITDPNDNALFAIHLIKSQGLTPWSASKSKWSKI